MEEDPFHLDQFLTQMKKGKHHIKGLQNPRNEDADHLKSVGLSFLLVDAGQLGVAECSVGGPNQRGL
uniref:Uncharacterized protein n=1 Tax=Oryza nivara TaxID=4536 RepID=A0A0E0HMR1_ORYNI